MIPGEYLIEPGEIEINPGSPRRELEVANEGSRTIQVGSHYHFYEVNPALRFHRDAALGRRLDIPAGTSVRFEPGQTRTVTLVGYSGARKVCGFAGKIMGRLEVGGHD